MDHQDDFERRVLRLVPSIAFRATVVVLLILWAAWLIYLVRDVLVLALLALVIAAAVQPPVAALQRRGLPRALAVAVMYLGLIAVVVALLAVIAPPLVAEARDFAAELPALLANLSSQLSAFLGQFGIASGGVTDALLGQLGSLGAVVSRIPAVAIGFITALVMVTFLSALMILERDRARAFVMRLIAPADRELADGLLQKAGLRLGAYVRGQLLIMLVTGVGSWLGLTLIGVPFALPLGIFAFLTEAIPIAGPIIAGVAMIAVAFIESPLHAVLTLGLVIVIQQAESLVLVPVIQGRLISIPPVVALLAVLAGSAVGDIPGAILAIPIVAIAMVVIEDVVIPWRRAQIADGGGGGEEPATRVVPPPDANPAAVARRPRARRRA